MTRRRWWLAALAVLCAFWVLGGEWVSIHHQVPENHLIDALGGLAYLAGGIVVLDRRPGNLIGPLMIAYGMVGCSGNWGNAGPVAVTADFETRLPEPVEAVAYFVVAESLANVAKYARACGAQVALSRCNGSLRVE